MKLQNKFNRVAIPQNKGPFKKINPIRSLILNGGTVYSRDLTEEEIMEMFPMGVVDICRLMKDN